MELYVLDDRLRKVQVVDAFESLIWTERFAESGDFQLVIASTNKTRNLLLKGTMVTVDDSYRVMTIENIEHKEDQTGRSMLTISGHSIEDVLKSRVAKESLSDLTSDSDWELTGTPTQIVKHLLEHICLDGALSPNDIIPYLVEGDFLATPGSWFAQNPDLIWDDTTGVWDDYTAGAYAGEELVEDEITVLIRPANLYDTIKNICDVYNLGFRFVCDFSPKPKENLHLNPVLATNDIDWWEAAGVARSSVAIPGRSDIAYAWWTGPTGAANMNDTLVTYVRGLSVGRSYTVRMLVLAQDPVWIFGVWDEILTMPASESLNTIPTVVNEVISPSSNWQMVEYTFTATTSDISIGMYAVANGTGSTPYGIVDAQVVQGSFDGSQYENSRLYFEVYQGIDRTTLQNQLPAVIFSSDLDNLQGSTEFNSIEESKNIAYVFSNLGFEVVIPVEIDPNVSGFDRRVLMVDASDVDSGKRRTLHDNPYLSEDAADYWASLNTERAPVSIPNEPDIKYAFWSNGPKNIATQRTAVAHVSGLEIGVEYSVSILVLAEVSGWDLNIFESHITDPPPAVTPFYSAPIVSNLEWQRVTATFTATSEEISVGMVASVALGTSSWGIVDPVIIEAEFLAKLPEILKQRGLSELSKVKEVHAFDGEISQFGSSYKYQRDFNLGDLTEFKSSDGVISQMRVTEHIRTHDVSGERSYPTLTKELTINPDVWYGKPEYIVWDDYEGVWEDA